MNHPLWTLIAALMALLVSSVQRGRIRLSGQGDALLMVMPIDAALGARKVVGVLKETATAKGRYQGAHPNGDGPRLATDRSGGA
jgi:hypothetical protein